MPYWHVDEAAMLAPQPSLLRVKPVPLTVAPWMGTADALEFCSAIVMVLVAPTLRLPKLSVVGESESEVCVDVP